MSEAAVNDAASAPVTAFPADEDARLMLDVGQGDEQALRRLVERWQRPLLNFFYRSVNSRELAEDLSQQVFIRLYRAAGRYEPRAKFSTFLFHVARRVLLNEFRRQSRKPLDPLDPKDLTEQGGSTDAREPLNILELEEAFAQAVECLPENQKTAIILHKQQTLSYAEIAEIMGASEAAVKSWIFRARSRLKELLADFYEAKR